MKKSKKIIIIILTVALIMVLLTFGATLMIKGNNSENEVTENESITFGEDEFDIIINEQPSEGGKVDVIKGEELNKPQIEIKENNVHAQTDILIDEWLRIESVGEYRGRFCAIVKNESEKDAEYVLMTVKTADKTLHFQITALMAGEKAIIFCQEDAKYSKDEYYAGWTIDNVVFYDIKPSMHSNRFKITPEEGAIKIKNKNWWKIKNPVKIVYKPTIDGLVVGTQTRRITIDSLKFREEKEVKDRNFKKDNCKIIFVEYD